MTWQTVIGLEIHAQLSTNSKIFSPASAKYGAMPNTQACEIDLGMPGMLPVLNQKALEMAVKFGIATKAHINKTSVFARKNYFYPDLPKGYQISQFELPIVGKGEVEIKLKNGRKKIIGITRAHLEEDAGKSLHEDFVGQSGIDLNRAGTPLLEIVSEPDLNNPEEAISYAKKIHQIVQFLEICDGNMQEGSFRIDANVSIHKLNTPLGTRTELKNINSFKFLEKAINYEINRHQKILEDGGNIIQETRLFDVQNEVTRSMRSKEEANDYRYFPDPDLLPVTITNEYISQITENLPELPEAKKIRFKKHYQINDYEIEVLTASKDLASFYEEVIELSGNIKLSTNWIIGNLSAALNKNNIEVNESIVSAAELAELLNKIADNTISGKIAKDVFEKMWETGKSATTIIEEENLVQIKDTSIIIKVIDKILADNPAQLEQYRAGKDKLFGFFVGQAMKATGGKINPQELNRILKRKLQ